jgi:hypothetical protein
MASIAMVFHGGLSGAGRPDEHHQLSALRMVAGLEDISDGSRSEATSSTIARREIGTSRWCSRAMRSTRT